jgi:hypothetical protein
MQVQTTARYLQLRADNLCVSLPLVPQAVAVSADESEEVDFQVSTAPDDLRTDILVNRMASSGAIPTNLLAGAALNLPNRGIVSSQSPCLC